MNSMTYSTSSASNKISISVNKSNFTFVFFKAGCLSNLYIERK